MCTDQIDPVGLVNRKPNVACRSKTSHLFGVLCVVGASLCFGGCAGGSGGGGGDGAGAGAGGQGSGGSGPPPNNGGTSGPGPSLPGVYETGEYKANHGLGQIGASAAYAAGASGEGIVVGVIDTGIDLDHPEFAGAISAASTDIVTGVPEFLDDQDGHGTAVAGVIAARRNELGSHGVAFESTILAVRADAPGSCASGCAFEAQDVAMATNYAATNGARVINYSLGGANEMDDALAESMASALEAGTIIVFAAGNGGEAEPTFPGRFAIDARARGRAILAGAVDADNHLADFSDRAGSARDAFLVAPGTEILTAALHGGSALASGTSFAAAHVSGAAALILDAAPFLTPEDVVDLLLDTATDLGTPGPDPIYGRGLLNLVAALSPQGTPIVPLGSSVEAGTAPLARSGVRWGAAFGSGPALGRAIFLDGYGRPYWFELDHRISTKAATPDLLAWLSPGRSISSFSAPIGADLSLDVSVAAAERVISDDRGLDQSADDDRDFVLNAAFGPNSQVTLSRGLGIRESFSLADITDSSQLFLSSQQLASPYVALTDAGSGIVVTQRFQSSWQARFGLGSEGHEERDAFERGPRTALVGELSKHWPARAQIAFQFGGLEEADGILDSVGDGAFDMPASARTRFLSVGGRLALGEPLALFGHASLGWTDPGPTNAGLIRDVSHLRSFSFGSGLAANNLLFMGDGLAIVVSQPLRVVKGSALIDRPISRSVDGRIKRQVDRESLVPAGREVDLELRYRFPVGQGRELSVNWLTQLEPGHNPEASAAHAVAFRFKHEF